MLCDDIYDQPKYVHFYVKYTWEIILNAVPKMYFQMPLM
jgi:hypothetical protein